MYLVVFLLARGCFAPSFQSGHAPVWEDKNEINKNSNHYNSNAYPANGRSTVAGLVGELETAEKEDYQEEEALVHNLHDHKRLLLKRAVE